LSDYVLSVILGIVEGLTEFLPVSSTAHLRLAEALLRVDLDSGYWKMYTIVIQLGAILVLPIYFRERIMKFLSTFPKGEKGDRTALTNPLGLTAVAFVVTAIPSFLLTKVIGKNLENVTVIGVSLLVGGVIMWAIDAAKSNWEEAGPAAPGSPIRTWKMDDMSFGQALWVGACQILSAVFPGTSRSMSTIAAGQIAGMSRSAALDFSFFVSIPTMFVATAYAFLKSVKGGHGENAIGGHIDSHGFVILGIGFVVSFVVAYAAVAWFLAWVKKHGFVPFAIYRIVLGCVVLAWLAHLIG
jgi:undecaprenyl-diphosphatase